MPFAAHVRRALADLERRDLLRQPRVLDSPQGPEITVAGRPAVNLCSNDYLGLANAPELRTAAATALDRWGLGAGASRHIVGSLRPHLEAERCLAELVSLPRALLFSSGYAANVGTVQALVGPGDVIFSDALNHASLIDGCRLSRARVFVYPHRDLDALESLLRAHRPSHRAALIVTESLFSMDGDLAPLVALRALAHAHDAGLLVDEAHALGVLGPEGRGACAAHRVVPDVLVGTLGKALGAAGAFCAGSPELVALVENRARSYVFSTAPPPHLAAALLAAVELAHSADPLRQRLTRSATRLRRGLRDLGYRVAGDDASPILPVHVGPPGATMALSAALLEHAVFVHGIRPPTVPLGSSRLRVTALASHQDAHLTRALGAFAALRDRYYVK